ncbi:MAG: hypothetical protein KAJ19_20730 [Gammaproteobacteria bacterium]|nr:hypothetical protein [Gammaproteobacteria bacterium]
MADDDIQQMIDDCESVKDISRSHGGSGFTDWEKGFLESVADQFEGSGSLTPRQRGILKRMWDQI